MSIEVTVIDDNPDDIYTIKRILDSTPGVYNVSGFEIAAEAMVHIGEKRPDCILVDYNLTNLTGLEFSEVFKQVHGDTVPIILLTGQGDEELAVNALKSGISDYLKKNNLSFDVLAKSIQYVIEKNKKEISEAENLRLIQKNLEEKEFILKEIHHRIKNHMASLQALVELTSGANPKTIINTLATRINTYRELYDNLCYSSDSQQVINLKEYLEKIMGYISTSFGKTSNNVECVIEGEELFINNAQAVIIGLIINELSTNSYKYAFNGDGPGRIDIQIMRDVSSGIRIVFHDNGSGMEPQDIGDTKKLGMRLIDLLVRQLTGIFEYENDDGLKYTIHLKNVVIFDHD